MKGKEQSEYPGDVLREWIPPSLLAFIRYLSERPEAERTDDHLLDGVVERIGIVSARETQQSLLRLFHRAREPGMEQAILDHFRNAGIADIEEGFFTDAAQAKLISDALSEAVDRRDATEILLTSLILREPESVSSGRNYVGDYFVVYVSEREASMLKGNDSVYLEKHWYVLSGVDERSRPYAQFWKLRKRCQRCRQIIELKSNINAWSMECCTGKVEADRLFGLAAKWIGLRQRISPRI